MNVIEVIKKRYSCRAYKDMPVRDEDLNQILESARLAPSARNLQEWRFIVVKSKETRQKICEAAKGRAFIGQAPVIIACCAAKTDYVMTNGQPAYPIDLAIAIDHMVLTAVELGLGTCWIGAFYQEKVKEFLSVPDNAEIVDLLLIGYPNDTPTAHKDRMSLEEIVMQEKWH